VLTLAFPLQTGLGKSLQVIMLALSHPPPPEPPREEPMKIERDYMTDQKHALAIKTTLVVAPATILHQWQDELQKHVREGGLTGCAHVTNQCVLYPSCSLGLTDCVSDG
jgi:SNF2 family DNA or RNA helicase